MARITRKELKSDKFALEIGQTVTFFEDHRQEFFRYGWIALAVVAIVLGYSWYARHQHAVCPQYRILGYTVELETE